MRATSIKPRTTVHEGRQYVSVTSAMSLVKRILGEPDDYVGINPQDLLMHQLEGTACHAVCLDWLAHKYGWLPDCGAQAFPAAHQDEPRWHNVLHAALVGFQDFVEQYDVVPIGIEQPSFSQAYGLVGHLDLYCTLQWKRSRIKAVIDLKFVAGLLESHRLQVRCYGRLDGFKDSQMGFLYHANRSTGVWKLEPVHLQANLEDVAAVANAARLYSWAQEKKR